MILINNKPLELTLFPDNTPKLKIDQSANLFTGLFSGYNQGYTVTWKYDDMSELFSVYSAVRAIQNITGDITLKIPYFPNARQDRVEETTDVFTLKYMCEIINSLKVKTVEITDAHSDVVCGLLNNVKNIKINGALQNALNKADGVHVLYYPDNGACKKYSRYLSPMYAFGIKKRDWETGEILGLDIVGEVCDKNIMLVDDICSKGGTFYHSAKKLKELGANKIYLYVTHCENTILSGDLINCGLVEGIFTTDSIYRGNHPLITVVSNDELNKKEI